MAAISILSTGDLIMAVQGDAGASKSSMLRLRAPLRSAIDRRDPDNVGYASGMT
jgi:hypothetical protein